MYKLCGMQEWSMVITYDDANFHDMMMVICLKTKSSVSVRE